MRYILPAGHPLFGAGDDIVAICVIAETVSVEIANVVLAARLEKLADHGGKQAQAIVKIAEYLNVPSHRLVNDREFGLIPETLEVTANWLIVAAIQRGELNAKMVNLLFGVGLISKAERDEVVRVHRLAA